MAAPSRTNSTPGRGDWQNLDSFSLTRIEPVRFFDFNSNGQIDFNDLVLLFDRL